MALKENYKNDSFDGVRKYQMIQNDDGTVSFVDVTSYTVEGDLFGADDINSTNKAINKATNVRELTLPASGWSDSYPYTQTVSASGITAADNIKLNGLIIPTSATADQVKVLIKSFGYLISNDDATGAGTITFKAYKKPTADLTVAVEGA